MDGTSDINCQQHDRLRNRLSHVSVWLYSSKPDLHLCIRIQHPVLGQEDSHAPDPPSDGGGDHGDDDGQRSLHPIIHVMLVTRHYKEHVIYSDHSRLLLSLGRRTDITQESTYEVCVRG